MSLKQLVDGNCGDNNPLIKMSIQFKRDLGRKDEGLIHNQLDFNYRKNDHMVEEFLGSMDNAPQSFEVNTLLKEICDIEQGNMTCKQSQTDERLIDKVPDIYIKDVNADTRQIMSIPLPKTVQSRQKQQVCDFFNSFAEAPHFLFANSPCFINTHETSITSNYHENGLTNKFFTEAQTFRQENSALSINDLKKNISPPNMKTQDMFTSNNASFWEHVKDEWAKLSTDPDYSWLSEYDDYCNLYNKYNFVEENPMQNVLNPLEKGKGYMILGDVPRAVLCFELAVQEEMDNAEAWELLGLAMAQNEMDPMAIAALNQTLKLQPKQPRVLMALAVCYTNEGLPAQAVRLLIQWLQIHPKYKHLAPHKGEATFASEFSLIQSKNLVDVQNMFLEAARLQPGQHMDAEVQEALGVLFTLSNEYDKAVDCFKAALNVQPNNAKLWNRLGASLANGSRSVEAIEAYQRALQLEPGYVRVRYNVGVCCLNLKAYHQATEHLLNALTMQASVSAKKENLAIKTNRITSEQDRMSESIWSTLRMTISLMGRNDLQAFVSERNLNALNESLKN